MKRQPRILHQTRYPSKVQAAARLTVVDLVHDSLGRLGRHVIDDDVSSSRSEEPRVSSAVSDILVDGKSRTPCRYHFQLP
jgi:hypothetical protein